MLHLIADALSDVRFGLRVLRRSPLFTVVALSSLALGIGGSAAVFALVNAIVLRALPVPQPEQLFVAVRHLGAEPSQRFSWPSLERLRDQLAGRAEICAASSVTTMQFRVAGGAPQGERGMIQLVSGEYFGVLRQTPQLGRLLTPADNRTVGAHPVVVISDGYWRRSFAASPDAVGRTLSINGAPFTVVGVAPRQFFGTTVAARGPDAWIPLMMQPNARYASNASSHDNADPRQPWPPQTAIEWLTMFVRVAAGTEPAEIAAAITTQRQAEAATAASEDDRGARSERVALEPAARGISPLRQASRAPLYVLLAMMGVLLAIACSNVAGLLMSRATAREREMAIRLSIGAGRGRLVRQLLAESLVLGAGGGLAGLALAVWGRDLLLRLFVSGSALVTLDTRFDGRVLAFAVGISLLTGLACGVIPALRGTRVPLADAMKLQSRSVGHGGRRAQLVGKALVAAQIAFCLLLLVVAGLFVRSLRVLTRADLGFDRAHVLGARLDVRSLGYNDEQRAALYDRVLARVAAIPGVLSASLSENGPIANSSTVSSLGVEGYTPREGERLRTNEETVTQRYFETVGLRILQGRNFVAADRVPASRATIVNQTMARRFFGKGDPIGRRWNYGDAFDDKAFVIVGVVEDAKYRDVKETTPNMAYRLYVDGAGDMLTDLEVRTAGAPDALVPTLRQALVEAEPQLPVIDILPLSDRVARNVSQDTVVAQLTSVFGAVALLLACLGLYGTVSYGVTQRVAELGLRLALGAERSTVMWMVIREAMVVVAIGGLVGLPLTYLVGRSLGTLLYEIPPVDPWAYAAGASILVAVAMIAAYLPAHRASRIEPMAAIAGQ
jgi:putative ABC transport system permease protein